MVSFLDPLVLILSSSSCYKFLFAHELFLMQSEFISFHSRSEAVFSRILLFYQYVISSIQSYYKCSMTNRIDALLIICMCGALKLSLKNQRENISNPITDVHFHCRQTKYPIQNLELPSGYMNGSSLRKMTNSAKAINKHWRLVICRFYCVTIITTSTTTTSTQHWNQSHTETVIIFTYC